MINRWDVSPENFSEENSMNIGRGRLRKAFRLTAAFEHIRRTRWTPRNSHPPSPLPRPFSNAFCRNVRQRISFSRRFPVTVLRAKVVYSRNSSSGRSWCRSPCPGTTTLSCRRWARTRRRTPAWPCPWVCRAAPEGCRSPERFSWAPGRRRSLRRTRA